MCNPTPYSGDVLIFLTGQDEVEAVVSRVNEQANEFTNDNKVGLVVGFFQRLGL